MTASNRTFSQCGDCGGALINHAIKAYYVCQNCGKEISYLQTILEGGSHEEDRVPKVQTPVE